MLNTSLLGVCIGIVVGIILYTFYWNRLAGLLISVVLRLLWWNQEGGSAWVQLGAIKFQLLAGRVLIKELRYHTSDSTIRVLQCTISWRYWLRRVSDEDDLSHARVGGEDSKTAPNASWPLSCRVHVFINGAEWFLFNRTASYDEILKHMRANAEQRGPAQPRGFSFDSSHVRETTNTSTLYRSDTDPSRLFPPSQPTLERLSTGVSTRLSMRLSSRITRVLPDWLTWVKKQLPNLSPKDLLPLSFRILNGAVVCGNSSTENLLMTKFTEADGTYGLVQSRSKYDLHKTIVALRFQNAEASYVENDDYKESMLDTGSRLHDMVVHERDPNVRANPSPLSFSAFGRLWTRLKLQSFLKQLQRAVRTQAEIKSGLDTHARGWRRRKNKDGDDPTPVGSDWATFEYAVERTVLETPVLELSYYCDVPGRVPVNPRRMGSEGLEPFDVGNGDLSPEWGIDVVIHGGFLRYGPWADRQRAELQRAFFPSTFHNNTAAEILHPGDVRQFTAMKLFIELREDTTLQIPFREPSKNWQWDGVTEVPRPKIREPAYLHLKAGDNSTVSYIVPMIATSDGFDSICAIHLDDFTITSSINDIPLLSAESCKILCEMPMPLKWNDQRQWTFDVTIRKPTLFLIREHINMLTDLGRDWASGPPAAYNRFIPMIYVVNAGLDDYSLNLYANDHNIIDKPLLPDENTLLTLKGTRLRSEVRMPSDKYRPEFSIVSFSFDVPDVRVFLAPPKWNTHSLFPSKFRTDIGRIGALNVDATFLYYAEVKEDNIDRLTMNIMGKHVALKAFGWVIRHFMSVQANYFGVFTSFSTLKEYLNKRANGQTAGDPLELKYRKGKSNIFQVELQLEVQHGTLMLPSELQGYESKAITDPPHPCALLSIPLLQLQLRLHDYFMEMSLNSAALSGNIVDHISDEVFLGLERYRPQSEQVVIDGLDIVANRLFGPQPRTSTYLCMWEIHVAAVRSSMNAAEGQIFRAALDSFRLGFSDPFNAPASEFVPPLDRDITFLNINIDHICVVWRSDKAAMELSLQEGLSMKSNDLVSSSYKKVTSLSVPVIGVKFLVLGSHGRWAEAGIVTLDVALDMYASPEGWTDVGEDQWNFVATQDGLTNRGRFLIAGGDDLLPRVGYHFGNTGLFLPHPRLPSFSRGATASVSSRANRMKDSESKETVDEESDEDSILDEHARDAQVAQNRISARGSAVPLTRERTNDDDSEIDEEGDDDSTDYWSDASTDSEHGSSSIQSDLLHYQRFVRQYRSQGLRRPALWNLSSFTLSQDRDFSFIMPVHGVLGVVPIPTLPRQLASRNAVHSCSVIRIACQRQIDVLVTPLVLSVLDSLLSDVHSNVPPLELRFDAAASSFTSTNTTSASTEALTLIDLYVTSFGLRSMQKVEPDSEADASIHGTTALDLGFSNLHLSSASWNQVPQVATPSTPWTVDFAVDSLIIQLGRFSERSSRHRGGFTLTLEPVFDFSISRSEGSLSLRAVQLDVGAITTGIDASSLKYGISTAHSLHQIAEEWRRKQSARESQGKLLSTYILLRLLQLAQLKAITDPLSFVQPSFLVQSGVPQSLRTNTGYKLLFYLRNCIMHLDSAERQSVVTVPPDTAFEAVMAELIPLLDAEWNAITPDTQADQLSGHPVLKALLPSSALPNVVSEKQDTESSKPSISLRFHGLHIFQRATGEDHRNSFTLSELVISGCLADRDLLTSTTRNDSSVRLGNTSVRKLSANCLISDIQMAIYPQIIKFIHEILRVQKKAKWPRPKATPSSAQGKGAASFSPSSSPLHLDVFFTVTALRTQISAQNVMFEWAMSGLSLSTAAQNSRKSLTSLGTGWSANQTVLCREIALRALATSATNRSQKQDLLASIVFSQVKCNGVARQDPAYPFTFRAVVGMESLHLSVPRSAIKLYRFVEEWRADYLPGVQSAIESLMSELEQSPKERPKPRRSASSNQKRPRIHVRGSLPSLLVSLQVMRGTWLEWGVNGITGFLQSGPRVNPWSSGIEVISQFLSISSTSRPARSVPPNSTFKLELPTLRVAADYGRPDEAIQLHMRILVDFFQLTISSSDLDTILSVQQKFGKDFNDLLHIIEQNRQSSAVSTPQCPSAKDVFVGFEGVIKLRGLELGFKGPTSTLYLECKDVGGFLERDHKEDTWNVSLRDLALSLEPSSTSLRNSPRKVDYRSAFLTVDVEADNKDPSSDKGSRNVLNLAIPKLNAVMQPSSVGEVGDFVDHILADMSLRREQRAQELEEFKLKTRNVMRTFDLKVRPVGPQQATSWLDNRTIKLRIQHIGVAFPLTLDTSLELPKSRTRDYNPVKAFLFSIKRLEFTAQRGETGQASMQDFSFQFVTKFRQSIPADFLSESHKSRNRLCYPEMEARVKTINATDARTVYIEATVSGFILDLDTSIPDFIFSLVDVYRHGKERVDRLAVAMPRVPSHQDNASGSPTAVSAESMQPRSRLSVQASMVFNSGRIRFHGNPDARYPSSRVPSSLARGMNDPLSDAGAEIFVLPRVSVWAEYRAPSNLVFKATIHSSENQLNPVLLPFVSEVVNKVESRMAKSAARHSRPSSLSHDLPMPVPESNSSQVPSSVSSMHITFSLRIDQSKLEFTCQPDVNVIGGVHWQSGGFVVTISPGAQGIDFTASVDGLSIGLKHGFLADDCVRFDARNLSFNLSFSKVSRETGDFVNSISLVVDTEFAGGVRFSRLQDILCFKAVWLDRIPMLAGQTVPTAVPDSAAAVTARTEATPQTAFVTVLLVRVRSTQAEADLGQSISFLNMSLDNLILRTKLTEDISHLAISVENIHMKAVGNVSGYLTVPNFIFSTIRRRENNGRTPQRTRSNKLLELRMTTGPLELLLHSEYQKLLQYRAQPIEVFIFDDWSTFGPLMPIHDRRLRLAFTVTGSDITLIATVGTIPKLVAYGQRFKALLESQREGASRESEAFRTTRAPKPENPLSDVASALIQSARDRLRDAESELSYAIRQHMSLRLETLRIVIFPRSMHDFELARFVGTNVQAQLDRTIEAGYTLAHRELHLSFGSMGISRFGSLNHASISASDEMTMDANESLQHLLTGASEATIFALPSMDMRMVSDEANPGSEKRLEYEFESTFAPAMQSQSHNDTEENIYISLNISLYSWLTTLRKTFTREMENAQLSDRRIGTGAHALLAPSLQRKKAGGDSSSPSFSKDPATGISKERPAISRPSTPPLSEEVDNGKSSDQTTTPTLQGLSNVSSPGTSPSLPSTTVGTPAMPASKTSQNSKKVGLKYIARKRHIERLTMRQLGEATPDVMHPFFMKTSGFNLEDSLPQYVHEYATGPLEEIMKALLELYSKQLRAASGPRANSLRKNLSESDQS